MLVLEIKFWEFESPLGHHFRKIGREVYCSCFESRSVGLSPARGFKSYIFRQFCLRSAVDRAAVSRASWRWFNSGLRLQIFHWCVAQLAAQRSPKPKVGGSTPPTPASFSRCSQVVEGPGLQVRLR